MKDRGSAKAGPEVLAVGVGVQRGGSTWLFRAIEEHPGAAGPSLGNNKEPDFFTSWWNRGEGWYAGLFPGPERVGVEFSVSYFPSLDATVRLHDYRPDARLVVCLRDPVDRIVSQHRLFHAMGLAPASLADALACNRSYIEQSRYGTHLERWIDTFGKAQVHAVLLDDVRVDPGTVLAGVYEHVGLPPYTPSMLESRINAPVRSDRRWVRNTMVRAAVTMRRVGGSSLLRAAERTGLPDRMRGLIRQAPPERSADDDRLLHRLRLELADEVRRTGELIGRDLGMWLPGASGGNEARELRR